MTTPVIEQGLNGQKYATATAMGLEFEGVGDNDVAATADLRRKMTDAKEVGVRLVGRACKIRGKLIGVTDAGHAQVAVLFGNKSVVLDMPLTQVEVNGRAIDATIREGLPEDRKHE